MECLETRRLLAADVTFQTPIELSAADQLVVELINRARSDPMAEAARYEVGLNSGVSEPISSDPKPPLAPHQSLLDASLLHSLDMLENDYFGHQGLDGSTPTSRAQESGYPGVAGENLALRFDSGQSEQEQAELIHEMLFHSPGHRRNMLLERYSEVGVALAWGHYDFDNAPNQPAVIGTEKFGIRSIQAITGVAFSDTVIEDDFYSVGEGWNDIRIEATDSSGQTFATLTGPSGGYRLTVPEGIYVVTAERPDPPGVVELGTFVVEGQVNLKLDIRVDQLEFDELPLEPDDHTPPVSSVEVVNFDGHFPEFLLRWSGTDEVGSAEEVATGIETFDVYVSIDSAAYQPWQSFSAPGEAHFVGEYGHSYAFYVRATDVAGNREPIPSQPDVELSIVSPWRNPGNPYDVDGNGRVNPFDALLIVSWLNAANTTIPPLSLSHEKGDPLEPPFLDVNGDGRVTSFDILLVVSSLV